MPEPSIVQIVIADGGRGMAVFPQDTQISANDSVFWLNQTSQDHQPAYTNPTSGKQILWGTPPTPLPPQKTSSQVVFQTAGKYSYFCTLHQGETGTITVT